MAYNEGITTTRFRSFLERYLIERAGHFRVGHEKEDAWMALSDATMIYKNIASRDAIETAREEEILRSINPYGVAQGQAQGQAPPNILQQPPIPVPLRNLGAQQTVTTKKIT